MTDDERIEQLELEVKVLQDINKGLKEKNKELSDSYDKLAKECNEENRRCMLLAVENQDLKDKIKEKIEDILNSENSEAIEKLIEWQSLLEKE